MAALLRARWPAVQIIAAGIGAGRHVDGRTPAARLAADQLSI